ncbi:MAG: carbamoyltransferase C-terminal domain-containing protein [Desulfarculaceae bacterium]
MKSLFKKIRAPRKAKRSVLGVQFSHDYSACLVQDGRVAAAVAEERLNRRKHCHWDWDLKDKQAIQYCLEAGGVSLDDVDAIVVTMVNFLQPDVVDYFFPEVADKTKLHLVGHHLSHAASAYYASPFDQAAILITDGSGAFERDQGIELESMYFGSGGSIEFLGQTYARPGPQGRCDRTSLGWLYQALTIHLGFSSFDAGKTMGLAPYGRPGRHKDLVLMDKDQVRPNPEYFSVAFPQKGLVPDEVYQVNSGLPRRRRDEPITQEHMDLAADLQQSLEEGLVELANRLYEKTRCPNLCLAGGVALNCVANKKILNRTPFEQVFIQPAAGDDGTALGNALYGWRDILGLDISEYVMEHAYLGRPYTKVQVKQAISEIGGAVRVAAGGDITAEVAQRLSAGQIIAWFQGGSEFGPRALGHRSILADPRQAAMKDILNARVKHREPFRPFAPSVLSEACSQFFDLDCESPFMLLAADTLSDQVPAITHVDSSARVQTVVKNTAPAYYELIRSFGQNTGVPVILNTSFNVAGEPIVETPQDALRTFTSTAIDALVLEDHLLVKA